MLRQGKLIENTGKKNHERCPDPRIFGAGFGDYLGPKLCLPRADMYGDITLVYPGRAEIVESFDYTDIERHIRFLKDGIISMTAENGDLILESSRYKRSVEILGNDGGGEFGWRFADNFFDLLPGQPKRVRVLGKHDKGIITVKGYYSDNASTVEYGI